MKSVLKVNGKSNPDVNSQTYINWIESRRPKCTTNFDTSPSKAMEAQGAVDVWGRSIEKHSLHYVDFVGDVDCSSHQDVAKPKASSR